MIHQNLIKRRADEGGLSAPAVERDYVLTHALAAISEYDRQARIVFKGGTALRLCHFEDYRYSADLDFSLIGGLDVESALRLVVDALADCRGRLGFPLLGLTGSTPPRIEYENVRLSHSWCNKRDWGWRAQVRTQLAKGKSLADIAEFLNRKGVPPAHGTNQWTAAMVRKAYVS